MTAFQDAIEAERPATGTSTAWLALILAGVSVLANVAGFVLGVTPSPSSAVIQANVVGSLATSALAATITVVGLILARTRGDNAIGWLFLVFGVVAGVSSDIWGVMYLGQLPGGHPEIGQAVAWIGATFTTPLWIYLITQLIIRFPSGVPETASDVRLLRLSLLGSVLAGVMASVRPGPFIIYPAFSNPLALPPALATLVGAAAGPIIVLAFIPALLGVWSMMKRYERTTTIARLQLRWFAFAAAVTFSGGLLYMIVGVLLAPRNESFREITYVIFVISACSLPLAVLQAIRRHRLYEIDRIIGRTFAYGALTAILAGVYAASVRLFNWLFVSTTGQESEAALVLTTLVLATTFTPIKTRLEKVAARRFPPEQPADAVAAPAGILGPGAVSTPELDARIEAIARRVAREELRHEDEALPR